MLYADALSLLKALIKTPSLSKQEQETAILIQSFLQEKDIVCHRLKNNIWSVNQYFNPHKPTILLNSHHDTVKPASGYTKNPFESIEEDGKLYGLGSNDAGGALVALIATFVHFYPRKDLNFNLILATTAEEEISGEHGIAYLLPELGKIDVGIVGEPTQMQMAIAEKGLMVIDGVAFGKSGHAARNEGENAIYKAIQDIQHLKDYQFEHVSSLLGAVKVSITQIEAGTQHNVVPDQCRFVIDVRTNECYTNEAVFSILQQECKSTLKARSFRLNSSSVSLEHPLIKQGLSLGWNYFGSPTLSDQALMNFPTLKIGPGDSARSHTADEFIYLEEIALGIKGYIQLLERLML